MSSGMANQERGGRCSQSANEGRETGAFPVLHHQFFLSLLFFIQQFIAQSARAGRGSYFVTTLDKTKMTKEKERKKERKKEKDYDT